MKCGESCCPCVATALTITVAKKDEASSCELLLRVTGAKLRVKENKQNKNTNRNRIELQGYKRECRRRRSNVTGCSCTGAAYVLRSPWEGTTPPPTRLITHRSISGLIEVKLTDDN